MGKRGAAAGVLALAVLAGCDGQDADRLARAGRKAAARIDDLTGGAPARLAGGAEAIRAHWDDVTLDARVAARLRWDKEMEGAHVEATSQGGTVTLHGTVPDLAQRRRAIELARSTRGCEEVIDEMEVAP
ncbi:MAG TPA: BON domain-containing protein [Gemmataceae bacterium]|nr:BON domain-containing protein [Gemmataceae bacterium]